MNSLTCTDDDIPTAVDDFFLFVREEYHKLYMNKTWEIKLLPHSKQSSFKW